MVYELTRRHGDLPEGGDPPDFEFDDDFANCDNYDDFEREFAEALALESGAFRVPDEDEDEALYDSGPLRALREAVLLQNLAWLRDPDNNPRVHLGRYELIRWVGYGGMGVVFLGYDPKLERCVAIKVLSDKLPGGSEAFEREAQTLARLAHPNLVEIHDFGEHEGHAYFVMEFVHGVNGRRWLRRRPPWPAVLRVFIAVGRGLAVAHGAGICHHDLKPENLLIGHDGRVRLVDFGLASSGSSGGGTLEYAAPEALVGEARDARSDQFSFCVMLYEALGGRRPFLNGAGAGAGSSSLGRRGGKELALIEALASGEAPAPLPAEIPAAVREAVFVGLSIPPGRRHGGMGALVAVLEAALAEEGTPRLWGRSWPVSWGRARGRLGASSVVSALAFGLGLVLLGQLGVAAMQVHGRGRAGSERLAEIVQPQLSASALAAAAVLAARRGEGERALALLHGARALVDETEQLQLAQLAHEADAVGMLLYEAQRWQGAMDAHALAALLYERGGEYHAYLRSSHLVYVALQAQNTHD